MNFLKKRFFDEWPSENLSKKLTTKKKIGNLFCFWCISTRFGRFKVKDVETCPLPRFGHTKLCPSFLWHSVQKSISKIAHLNDGIYIYFLIF